MNICVGVVGLGEFIDSMEQAVDRLGTDSHLLIQPVTLSTIDEMPEWIADRESSVDFWIFPDDVIRRRMTTRLLPNSVSYFVPMRGSNFFETWYRWQCESQRLIHGISLDSVARGDVEKTVKKLLMPLDSKQLYVPSENIVPDLEQLVSFHRALFTAGKVNLCMTGSELVYDALQRLGIPVARMTSDLDEVERFLQSLVCQYGFEQNRRAQMAVQVVQVGNFNQLMDESDARFYNIYRTYLQTQELLIDYTEEIFGTFVSIGNGRFMIFSTQGYVEDSTYKAMSLLRNITELTKLGAKIGMGYGITAFEAEKNARLALNYADKASKENCIYLVDGNRTVSGPLEEPNSITFKFRTEDKDLIEKLNTARVSIATFEKIQLVQRDSVQSSITASDVAQRLEMTERNARKILSALQKSGLAELIGQETPTSKGRPRQVFRIAQ